MFYTIVILTLCSGSLFPFCTAQGKCGFLDSCDRLVSTSIFQVGTCGRAARCNWELMHLETHLLGDSSNVGKYEKNILEALCNLPTYGAYKAMRKIEETEKDTVKVCGESKGDRQFYNYPMPMQYYYWNNTIEKQFSLERMERCMISEKNCSQELSKHIESLCLDALASDPGLKKSESKIHVLIREKMAYKISNMTNNKCNLDVLVRKRIPSPEDANPPTYEDVYQTSEIYPTMRAPFFDLYLLYTQDPKDKMSSIPEEDRWWNETKAYRALVHYLPKQMIEHIHEAIYCVYDRVPELIWKPEKFCWATSTFTCVQIDKVKEHTCPGDRHEIEGKEVPTTPPTTARPASPDVRQKA